MSDTPYIDPAAVPLDTDYQQQRFLRETVIPFMNRANGHAPGVDPAAEGDGAQNASPGDRKSGLLEDDFPGVKALAAADVLTYEAVREFDRDQLIALDGIGEKTADAILAASGGDDAA